jgi:MYXO-CTERM domain-containing protein
VLTPAVNGSDTTDPRETAAPGLSGFTLAGALLAVLYLALSRRRR